MSGLNGFDRIARIYDLLNGLVFGKAARQAQVHFLPDVAPHATIMILGGGAGWLLQKVIEANPSAEIWYIDASRKMIELSARRTKESPRIHFIHGTEADIPTDVKWDIVITPFFLDLFREESLDGLIYRIGQSLADKGSWLASDFVNGKPWWQRVLLRAMYTVIHLMCGIEAKNLPDWQSCLHRQGFIKSKSQFFYGGFIESTVFHKIPRHSLNQST